MANRRWGFHSGKLTCYDLQVDNDMTISGDLTFGDASTDTLTVAGKLDANGNVDLGSGNDTINIGSGSGDTVNVKENATFATSKKLYFRDTGLYVNSGADGKLTISADGTGTDDITLSGTVTASDHITVSTDKKLYFRDTGLYINSSADGQLDIVADTTVAISGATTMDSTLTVTGKITANGDVDLGSGDDTINIGSGSGDTVNIAEDFTVATDKKAYFRDTGLYIYSSADGQLDIVADTTLAFSGAATFDNSLELTGADSANTITWSGTNTAATPALKFPDDTYIADADGSVGASAGFIVVDIGGTNYKLQTYAMS